MIDSEQRNFLMSPIPPKGNLNWSQWIDMARQVDPSVCIAVLREPRPYWTDAHLAASYVLNEHGWEVMSGRKGTFEYHEYISPTGVFWQRLPIRQQPSLNMTVMQIMFRLAQGADAYVEYRNRANDKYMNPLAHSTSLKLVPRSNGMFDRYWRDQRNRFWTTNGLCDLNQSIRHISPVVHVRLFDSEVQATRHVGEVLMKHRSDKLCLPIFEES